MIAPVIPLSATELVGMWPLNAQYKGANLVPGRTNISLIGATYPMDGPLPDSGAWASPPLYFPSGNTYGSFEKASDVLPHSGSYGLIAALYRPASSSSTTITLITWNTGSPNYISQTVQIRDNLYLYVRYQTTDVY